MLLIKQARNREPMFRSINEEIFNNREPKKPPVVLFYDLTTSKRLF